jgi:hypothetical protein
MSTIVKLPVPVFRIPPLEPHDYALVSAGLRAGKIRYISAEARRRAADFFTSQEFRYEQAAKLETPRLSHWKDRPA